MTLLFEQFCSTSQMSVDLVFFVIVGKKSMTCVWNGNLTSNIAPAIDDET